MLMIKKNLSVYWNNPRSFNAHCGYVLMDVLMALGVTSILAVSSLMILSFAGNYYVSVAVRKEIVVSTFSFLEQMETGFVPSGECFRKGPLVYTVHPENRSLLAGEKITKGEMIAIEGNEGNQRQRITFWRPLISP